MRAGESMQRVKLVAGMPCHTLYDLADVEVFFNLGPRSSWNATMLQAHLNPALYVAVIATSKQWRSNPLATVAIARGGKIYSLIVNVSRDNWKEVKKLFTLIKI